MQSNDTYLIVLMTHTWGSRLEFMYNKLKTIHDTILLVDNSTQDYTFPEESIFFNKSEFEQIDNISEYKTFMNNFNPFFKIYDTLIKYNYVYMIEYDVEFLGSWERLFNLTDGIKSDLIISSLTSNYPNIKKRKNTRKINEDEILKIGKVTGLCKYSFPEKNIQADKSILDIPSDYFSIGLCSFSRYSKKYLNFLYNELPHYKDYFELLIPSLALYHNFSIISLLDTYPDICGVFLPSIQNMQINVSYNKINKLFHPIKVSDYYEDWKKYKSDYTDILNSNLNPKSLEDYSNTKNNYEEFFNISRYDPEGELIKNVITYKFLEKLKTNNACGLELLDFLRSCNIINRNQSNNLVDFKGSTHSDDMILYLIQGCSTNIWMDYEFLIEIIKNMDKYNPGLIFKLLIVISNMNYHNTKTCDIRTILHQALDEILKILYSDEKGKSRIIKNYQQLISIHDYNIPEYIKDLADKEPEEYESSYHVDFIEKYKDFLTYLDMYILLDYKNIAI